MPHQEQQQSPTPRTAGPGIFLPTMVWTSNRQTVENEMFRLMAWEVQLNLLVAMADASDEGTTWLAMAEASLNQLSNDISDLYEWLQFAQPGAPAPQ